MSELFVSYDLALQLKEKGFKRQLDIAGNLTGYNLSRENKRISYYHVHTQFPSDKEFLYAPLYQQVIDWFREKHGIHFDIDWGLGWGYGFITVGCIVDLPNKYYEGNPQWNYYEALTKAIEQALKLI